MQHLESMWLMSAKTTLLGLYETCLVDLAGDMLNQLDEKHGSHGASILDRLASNADESNHDLRLDVFNADESNHIFNADESNHDPRLGVFNADDGNPKC